MPKQYFQTTLTLAALGLLAAGPWSLPAAEAAVSPANLPVSPVDQAISQAAAQQQYFFLLFRQETNAAAAKMRQTANGAVQASKGRATMAEVALDDAANAAVADRFRVRGAPMPLLLVLAPNGAVTAGFPRECEAQALAEAMVGPKAAACLKSLQEGKVVVICVQQTASKDAETTRKTVADFKADPRISGFAESVVIDPADQAERSFLGKLRLDPKREFDTTLLVTPPGRIVGSYTNAVTKEAMFADLARSMAGATCGGGGCGPASGGCGPQ